MNDLNLLFNTFSVSNLEIHGLTNVARPNIAGYLKSMPEGISLAYFVPNSPNNLISLGYIEKSGGLYLGHGGILTVLFPVGGKYLTSTSNMIKPLVYPVNFTDGKVFAEDERPDSITSTLIKAFGLNIAISESKECISYVRHSCAFEAVDEEIALAVKVQHERMAHPGLDCMKTASKLNQFGEFTIDDIKLYEKYEYPCDACMRGKFRNSIHTLPQNLPITPTRPGQTIVMDVNKLSVPSPEGFTHRLVIIDVYSSHLTIVGMKSKHDFQILDVVKETIKLTFTAHNWKVEAAICDSEGCFVALRPQLSELGIYPIYAPPGFHARIVERYIQTVDTRTNALLQGLPFIVPAKFLLYTSQYTCLCLNLLPNKRTCRLSGKDKGASPRDIITKFLLPKFRGLKVLFGDRCSIEDGDYKRNQFRFENRYTRQLTAKASNATLIAIDPTLMQYIFLTDNGKIVSRGEFGLATGSFPPNWIVKPGLIDKTDKVKLVTEELFTPLYEYETSDDEDDDDNIILTPDESVDSIVSTTSPEPIDNASADEIIDNLNRESGEDSFANVPLNSIADDLGNDDTSIGRDNVDEITAEATIDPNDWEISHLTHSYYSPFQEKVGGRWIQGAKYYATHWKNSARGTDGTYDKTYADLIRLKFSAKDLSKLPNQAAYERNLGLAPGSMNVNRQTLFPKKLKVTKKISIDTVKHVERKPSQSLAKSALVKLYDSLLKVDSRTDKVFSTILIPEKFSKSFDKLFNIMELINSDLPILANASVLYDYIDEPKQFRYSSQSTKKKVNHDTVSTPFLAHSCLLMEFLLKNKT